MVVLFLAAISFQAHVNKTTVEIGESFLVTVDVTSDEDVSLKEPEIPEMESIDIVGKSSSRSTQIQFVNGKMSRSVTISYKYNMIPEKEGELTIPSFTLEYQKKKYETRPVKINVVSSSRSKTPDREEAMPEISDEKVFLKCSVSDDTVYPGEGVKVTFKLYTRVNLSDLNMVKQPDYSGAWSESIVSPGKLNFKETIIGGRRYSTALLKSDLLFSMEAGKIKISPMIIDVVLSGGVFSMFGDRKRILSDRKTVKVRDFPQESPPHFKDAVGNLSMKLSMDTSNVEEGTPFPLKIEIEGEGNLDFMSPPDIPEGRNYTVFRPESDEDTRISGKTLKGKRTFTYLINPEESGVIEIPEIKWSYFNPVDKKFIQETAGPFSFRVSAARKEDDTTKVKTEDIAYVLPTGNESVPLIPVPAFYILLIPLFILGYTFYHVREKRKMMSDREYAGLKTLPRKLKKGFQSLDLKIEEKNSEDFYFILSKLLLRFLKFRFKLDAFSLTRIELYDSLKEKNIDDEFVGKIKEFLNRSEQVRFASVSVSREEMEKDRKELRKLINELH